jgi:hypothetical protein
VANPRANGMLQIKGVQDKKYSATVLAEEFFKNLTLVPKVMPDKFVERLVIMTILLYIGFPLLASSVLYQEYRQTKKLKKLLNISE